MAYRANPFMERTSERTSSDQSFVRLFSPKIFERLEADAFEGAVHVFRSSPGGGKTTLLRAFTPSALHAFWIAGRSNPAISEAYRILVERQVIHDKEGPQMLGVLLSCASGFADLPPGATDVQEGLFRALLDCRIVLRSLRSLAVFAGYSSVSQLSDITLEYEEGAQDLQGIPCCSSPAELADWAVQRERAVYAQLDSLAGNRTPPMPSQTRYEGVLWLQSVRFVSGTREIAQKRLLMIDDLHALRKKQRALLVPELVNLRPRIPIWLAERTIALGDSLLAQGAREGRELREYALEEAWSESNGRQQFVNFGQNILDRRLSAQDVLPQGDFSQYLRAQLQERDVASSIEKGTQLFTAEIERPRKARYSEWISRAKELLQRKDLDALRDLYVTQILLVRDERKRQLQLDLGPLSADDLELRDNSQVQGAADIFMNHDLAVPYYYGMETLCSLATFNVEELLSLAAALYDALLAKQMLRKPQLHLTPQEQEKLIKEVARRRRDFIPKSHTEGARAQRLLDAIGAFCQDRTFLPNAPYAPGVTGVRLATSEMATLTQRPSQLGERATILRRVLSECVAENLLVTRDSAASTSRESGTVFYLNRMFCAYYGLPLQMGGWQDVGASQMSDWMETGPSIRKQKPLEIG